MGCGESKVKYQRRNGPGLDGEVFPLFPEGLAYRVVVDDGVNKTSGLKVERWFIYNDTRDRDLQVEYAFDDDEEKDDDRNNNSSNKNNGKRNDGAEDRYIVQTFDAGQREFGPSADSQHSLPLLKEQKNTDPRFQSRPEAKAQHAVHAPKVDEQHNLDGVPRIVAVVKPGETKGILIGNTEGGYRGTFWLIKDKESYWRSVSNQGKK